MPDLLPAVARYCDRYDLLPAGSAVVVGVSGGPDSLCLLHLLTRLAPPLNLRLHVAHLDHGLRGAASAADAAAVGELAAAWDLPFTLGRAGVPALAAQGHLSIEEAARQARYAFLAQVAGRAGAQIVAVAHHADDQAETVLMHFLRGSGVAGLRGMLPKTPLGAYRLGAAGAPPADGEAGAGLGLADEPGVVAGMARAPVLVRPLLECDRAEIVAYCAEHGLQPRYDLSNADTAIYRNRLRHELLPLLATYNPNIKELLAHTATVMAGDYAVLDAATAGAWAQITRAVGPDAVTLDLVAWRGLPLGLQRATVREAIRRLRAGLRDVNWQHVERGVWLAREGSTGQVATLTAGLELAIGYDVLWVQPAGQIAPPPPERAPFLNQPIVIAAPGTTDLPGGWRITVRRLARAGLPPAYNANPDPWSAWLDAGAVGPTLTLRPRQPGDRFAPQGLQGHTTRLNEFMIDAKVPRAARAGWPLLEGRLGIAWVCGLRLAETAAIGPETGDVWYVAFHRSVM